MPFDVNAFLDDLVRKGNLSQEERNQAAPFFQKVAQELEGGYLRQSDYSRRLNELQEKMKAEDEFAQRLAEYEAELKAKEAALPGAHQAGFTPAPQPPPPPPPPAPDLKGYVKADEAQRALMDTFKAQVELLNISQEHQQKFGKPLDGYDRLVQEALSKGQSLRDTWRQVYNVEARERELAEAEVQRRIQEAVASERQKWVTETSLEGGRPFAAQPSPFLQAIRPEKEAPGNLQQRNERVQAAVQAFQEMMSSQR